MKTTTFSQLRNNARKYFDLVESGESVEIYRHGKPIAVLSPSVREARARWKKSKPMDIPGVSLSKAIIEERKGR